MTLSVLPFAVVFFVCGVIDIDTSAIFTIINPFAFIYISVYVVVNSFAMLSTIYQIPFESLTEREYIDAFAVEKIIEPVTEVFITIRIVIYSFSMLESF